MLWRSWELAVAELADWLELVALQPSQLLSLVGWLAPSTRRSSAVAEPRFAVEDWPAEAVEEAAGHPVPVVEGQVAAAEDPVVVVDPEGCSFDNFNILRAEEACELCDPNNTVKYDRYFKL